MKNNKPVLFLDIDGVIALDSEFGMRRDNEWKVYPFNKKAVSVLNDIIKETDCDIILSSDWRLHFDLTEIDKIFKWNNVIKSPVSFTEDFRPIRIDYDLLEIYRCNEILDKVSKFDILNWCAIDDMNLYNLPEENFVQTPKSNEGIKQTGIKEKLIKKLK